jgi:HAMP domain-containing protein
VTFGDRRRRLVFRLRHPRTTIRWRLTLLYGALFLASGAALLAITYTLVDHSTVGARGFTQFVGRVPGPPSSRAAAGSPNVFRRIGPQVQVPARIRKLLRTETGKAAVAFGGSGQRIADLHQLEVESVIALAIMAVISGALGWLVAGRVLRPLRTMTATTQQISEASLDQRLAIMISNTGSLVPADQIDRLLQPFQRLSADRVGRGDGLGLGLSIVVAIAKAHDAALDVHPGTVGGLQVEVRFPQAPDGNPQTMANGDDAGTKEPLVGREAT